MAYTSEKIVSVINRMNRQYYLPAIQREFVWRPEQIIELFDSILRRYPIGSFLFWRLNDENKENWEVYEFVTEGRHGGVRNDLANTTGVHDMTMILDGQQRLTSLLLGLKGSYLVKKKYYHWDNPKAWEKQSLHIDLFDDPTVADESGTGVYYGLKFLPNTPAPDDRHYWLRVGKVLDFQSVAEFDRFKDAALDAMPDSVTKGQTRQFQKNIDRLYQTIWMDDVIAYYTEQEQDYDRVLDIFVRANEGGTKLSKSDLLLSMVTAKWGTVNAREEIFGLVERVNNDLARKNNLDKDFVMKTCLVAADLQVAYRVNNFNNENLAHIERQWPNIRDAIVRTLRLVNSFGIDRDTLTSANALIPIVYYMLHNKGRTLLGERYDDVVNARLIQQWLTMSLLNNVFSGQSDVALTNTRNVIRGSMEQGQFPTHELNAALLRSGRSAAFDEIAMANFLELSYGAHESFLALSLLYDEHNWGAMQFHQDHIFPQSLFSPVKLAEFGLSPDQQMRYRTLFNRVGNQQLLSANENLEKLNKPFDEWLQTRHPSARERHLIPDKPAFYGFSHFEEFVTAREDLIRQRLTNLFTTPFASDSVRLACPEMIAILNV
ncbi:DUF262 domain-containing protein [soil metagenome]